MTKAELYRYLAVHYGYTPQQIAEMTLDQQWLLVEPQSKGDPNTITFNTHKEYQQWLAVAQR